MSFANEAMGLLVSSSNNRSNRVTMLVGLGVEISIFNPGMFRYHPPAYAQDFSQFSQQGIFGFFKPKNRFYTCF